MIMKLFLPNYVQFTGLKISGALEEFSITLQVFGSKMQKLNFEENKCFVCSFLHIEVQAI